MDQRFIPELNERLFTHFVGGAWRAPYSDRHLPVRRASGGRLGRIVCAGPADLARAVGLVRNASAGAPAGAPGDAPGFLAALMEEAPLLAAMRAEEGFAGDALKLPVPLILPASGPLVLLTAAAVPVDRILGALIAGAPAGLIWKPAPGAAASAHLIMRALGPLAGGRLALVQGDHATGAALAGQGALIWAGEGPAPAGLPAPAVSLAARSPARR